MRRQGPHLLLVKARALVRPVHDRSAFLQNNTACSARRAALSGWTLRQPATKHPADHSPSVGKTNDMYQHRPATYVAHMHAQVCGHPRF
jgi:hypothetical protein